jgi:hypothetical protein
VLLVLIAELVLSLRWNRAYFTIGVPIFRSRVDRPQGLADVPIEELTRRSATAAGAPLVFRHVAPNAIAFREKPFGGTIHYAPLMRGVIRYTAGEASVVVAGLLNWTFLALLLAFALLLGKDFDGVAIYFAVAFAILYLIQGLRFARVAKALRNPEPKGG